MNTEIRALAPSIALAALIVVAGVVAGLAAGGAFREAAADPSPTQTPVAAVGPTPVVTLSIRPATPRPSPTPTRTPEPSIAIPTPEAPGENGLIPPLPRIEIAGGDPEVVAALDAAVDGLGALSTYRFRTGVSGRSIMDLSTGGIDLGTDGSLVAGPERAIDLLLGFRMVEFECSAATSSSSRYVVIGAEAWTFDDGVAEPIDGGQMSALIDELTPAGVARRVLLPFAEGYERVGPEERDGIPATRYRATDAGLHAYASATGIEGTWTADAWVADSGALIATWIEGRGDGPCDGFLADITVRDVDDATITITRPAP